MQLLKQGGFTFKRFFVGHDKSPMKVTTDSCLLGAWAPIHDKTKKILDIGCGCGVIALMLAQRLEQYEAQIDAVDIDANAIKQCQDNIYHAPFSGITAYCEDINEYKTGKSAYYDLIVSNPPYFAPGTNCRDQQRQYARYTENLNFIQLITITKQLLKPDGYFCLVLPSHLTEQFIQLSTANRLCLTQRMDVRYTIDKSPSLVLMAFTLQSNKPLITQELCLRDSNNNYTKDFRNLLHTFYLFRNN